jgi:hypothetical protein
MERMSREGRFEKLERERQGQPGDEGPRVTEARFSTSPDERPDPAGPHAPAMEAAKEHSPLGSEGVREGLQRFEADGASHLSLDLDPLMRLPFRRCPGCERDSSKFDRTCIHCGASLETPEARALNLTLLEALMAERAAAEAAQREAHQAELQARADEAFQRAAEEERALGATGLVRWRVARVMAALGCFALAAWSASFCPAVSLLAIGLVLLASALPREALEALASPARRRWW